MGVERKAHKEVCREQGRVWRLANPEKSRAIAKAWSTAHPEQKLAIHHKRRARKRNAPGKGWTAADVAAQYKAQRGKCFYCSKPLGKQYHRDHITPLAKGGAHCRSNLALACPGCNFSKQARDPQDFGLLL